MPPRSGALHGIRVARRRPRRLAFRRRGGRPPRQHRRIPHLRPPGRREPERRLPRRAGASGGAQGRPVGPRPQPGARALRGRASGAGSSEPPGSRESARRGDRRGRPALVRHGVGPGCPDHGALRPRAAHRPSASRAACRGVRGGPACARRRGRSPGHQAFEHPGDRGGREPAPEDPRPRCRPGARPAAHRGGALHSAGPSVGNAVLRGPRAHEAGGAGLGGGCPLRRVLARACCSTSSWRGRLRSTRGGSGRRGGRRWCGPSGRRRLRDPAPGWRRSGVLPLRRLRCGVGRSRAGWSRSCGTTSIGLRSGPWRRIPPGGTPLPTLWDSTSNAIFVTSR